MATTAAFSFEVPASPVRDQAALLHDVTLGAGVSFVADGHTGGGVYCATSGFQVVPFGSADLLYETRTVMAWVKAQSPTVRRRVIACLPNLGGYAWQLLLSNADGFPVAQFGIAAAVGPTSLLDGQWHHVLGTYDGTTTSLWVDGVQVATATGGGHNVDTSRVLTVGYDTVSPGAVDAYMDDVRFLNDETPHPTSSETAPYWRDTPVSDQMEAAYSFNEASGDALNVAWHTGRDAVVTGTRVAGHTGTGLLSSGTPGAVAAFDPPMGMTRRFTLMGWVKVTDPNQYVPIMSIYDDDDVLRAAVYFAKDSDLAGGDALQINYWDDTGTKSAHWTGYTTPTLGVDWSQWHHVALAVAVGETRLFLDGEQVYISGSGAYEFTGFSYLYIGGDKTHGNATWDDVRLTSNYVGSDSQIAAAFAAAPVVAVHVLTAVGGLPLGGGAAARVQTVAAGALTLGGYGLMAVARTASGALGLAGAAATLPVHVLSAVGGPTVGGSTKTEQSSGDLTAFGALSLSGATSVVVFEGTVATSAYGALSLGGSAAVVAPVAVAALGALSLGVVIEWERIGGQGYVLDVRGREARLGAVAGVPSPFRYLMAEVPQALVKVGGTYRLVDETDGDLVAQAERVFLGGRRYVVDDVARAELIEAGYGDWLTS